MKDNESTKHDRNAERTSQTVDVLGSALLVGDVVVGFFEPGRYSASSEPTVVTQRTPRHAFASITHTFAIAFSNECTYRVLLPRPTSANVTPPEGDIEAAIDARGGRDVGPSAKCRGCGCRRCTDGCTSCEPGCSRTSTVTRGESSASGEGTVDSTSTRRERFDSTTGAISWGGRSAMEHPDRCMCQTESTPHKHYLDPPHACARCACSAYTPEVPASAPEARGEARDGRDVAPTSSSAQPSWSVTPYSAALWDAICAFEGAPHFSRKRAAAIADVNKAVDAIVAVALREAHLDLTALRDAHVALTALRGRVRAAIHECLVYEGDGNRSLVILARGIRAKLEAP